MDPNKPNSKPWSIDALYRQIEHQNSEFESYQRRATLFLRISLATIGVIVGAVSIFGPQYLSDFLETILSFSLPDAANQLTFSPAATEVVIGILYFEMLVFLVMAGYKIISIPVYTFLVAYPKRLKPGMVSYQSRRIYYDDSINSDKYVISKLRQAIVENETVIEETKHQLEQAFEGVKEAIIFSFLGTLAFVALIAGGNLLDLAVVLFTSIAAVGVALRKFSLERYGHYFDLYWETDAPLFLTIPLAIGLWYTVVPADLAFIIWFALMFTPIVGMSFTTQERLAYALIRLVIGAAVSVVALYVHASLDTSQGGDIVGLVILGLMFGSLLLTISSIISYNTLSIISYLNKNQPIKGLTETINDWF